MKNAYLYPLSARVSGESNPYLDDFTQCLSNEFSVVNKNKPSNSGIFDMLKYINKIHIVFFNWIEDLPDKKVGMLQTILFLIMLPVFKIKGIKIFYTLHNKESHYTKNGYMKRTIRRKILCNADFILCHATEGLNILTDNNHRAKARYIPHPFKKAPIQDFKHEKKYDILIWGAIRPYKGIDNYLTFLESKKILKNYRTLIIGKIFPKEYEVAFNRFESEIITIENKYVDDETLNELINLSSIILFTYNEKTVLSSGALIYSLAQGAFVIGPNTGAFRDMYSEGLIDVFDDYDDLILKINYHLINPSQTKDKLKDFINNNSWEKFGAELTNWINGYNNGTQNNN
jgi:glycosyltransferase involved in cell wall biosynthesis